MSEVLCSRPLWFSHLQHSHPFGNDTTTDECWFLIVIPQLESETSEMFSLRPSELFLLTTERTFHHFLTRISWFNGGNLESASNTSRHAIVAWWQAPTDVIVLLCRGFVKASGWWLSASRYWARLRLRRPLGVSRLCPGESPRQMTLL